MPPQPGVRNVTPGTQRKPPETVPGPSLNSIINPNETDTNAITSRDAARNILIKNSLLADNSEEGDSFEGICQALLDIIPRLPSNSRPALGQAVKAAIYLLYESWEEELVAKREAEDIEQQIENKVDFMLRGALEKIQEATDKIIENHMANGLTGNQAGTHPVQNQTFSYAAAAAKSTIPAEHVLHVTRGENHLRSVFIDPKLGSKSTTESLTERELLQKATLTLDTMTGDATADSPDDTRFTSVKKLRNGGALLELNSAEAATWLRQPDVLEMFVQAWDGGQSKARMYNFPVIAKFVPTAFSHDDPDAHSEIEEGAGLPAGSVVAFHWLKPLTRRYEGQQYAHAVVTLNSPDAANMAISNGLVMEGKKVETAKLQQEVYRCLKCQTLNPNHKAANCPAPTEVCGSCRGPHRTAECDVQKRTEHSCSNCAKNGLRFHGHGTWDRTCPSFLNAQEDFNKRSPLNAYRFYPTAAPSTWCRYDDTPAPSLRSRNAIGNSKYPQSNLPRNFPRQSQPPTDPSPNTTQPIPSHPRESQQHLQASSSIPSANRYATQRSQRQERIDEASSSATRPRLNANAVPLGQGRTKRTTTTSSQNPITGYFQLSHPNTASGNYQDQGDGGDGDEDGGESCIRSNSRYSPLIPS